MIKKPWQIWVIFSLSLVAVVVAMLWLSNKIIQLDALGKVDRAETELARREAELQERISSALYRMDLKLLPLVTAEAGRPYYFYEPFYQSNVAVPAPKLNGWRSADAFADDASEVPSPLLLQTPQFVKLHFQIAPSGKVSSPQLPRPDNVTDAIARHGLKPSKLQAIRNDLRSVRQFCDYQTFLERCSQFDLAVNQSASSTPSPDNPVVGNGYNVPAVQSLLNQINSNSLDQTTAIAVDNNKQILQQQRGNSRLNIEFNRRGVSTNTLTNSNQILLDNQSLEFFNSNSLSFPDGVRRQGILQAIWVDDQLMLARAVEGTKQTVIQCCWLDWDAIQASLRTEIEDLLPHVKLQPLDDDPDLNLGTALTTIPVQVIVDREKTLSTLTLQTKGFEEPSGLKISLILAWCGIGLAALATAVLLNGVVSLSERRAAFVSAVTHELRTPLTTFRMYAEMMVEKMVPPEKQLEYAKTLKVQADRLSHLVDNVLQFARLERSADRFSQETTTVNELIDRFSSRLEQRANEANLQLNIEIEDTIRQSQLTTQPSVVEQILFNLVDNACKYARPSKQARIDFRCDESETGFRFLVQDYGPGISTQDQKNMFKPFHKSDIDAANTAPGVGLGLALCRRMAKSIGGKLYYQNTTDGAIFVFEIHQ